MPMNNQAAIGNDGPDARDEVRMRLLGAWQLVSYTAKSADGEVILPFGPDP
ncbi:hypothetical protein [Streptomyces sp. NPDC002952]|uniref:hypothetical protein n=1 Tax=Streptomyces sp. NPDC002952 TaxID=3364673 RepID=UPI0036B4C83B